MWGQARRSQAQNLFEDARRPIFRTDEIEYDAQMPRDTLPELHFFNDLPKCRFITTVRNYCFSGNPRHPKITPILIHDIDHERHFFEAGIAYNSTLLSISVTFRFIPAFGEILPRKVEEVHSVDSIKTHIIDLATVLTYAQDSFMGGSAEFTQKGSLS